MLALVNNTVDPSAGTTLHLWRNLHSANEGHGTFGKVRHFAAFRLNVAVLLHHFIPGLSDIRLESASSLAQCLLHAYQLFTVSQRLLLNLSLCLISQSQLVFLSLCLVSKSSSSAAADHGCVSGLSVLWLSG